MHAHIIYFKKRRSGTVQKEEEKWSNIQKDGRTEVICWYIKEDFNGNVVIESVV